MEEKKEEVIVDDDTKKEEPTNEELQKELEETKEKLKKEEDKDKNFNNLKKKTEEKEEKGKEKEKTMQEQVTSLQEQIDGSEETRSNDIYKTIVDSIVSDDDEKTREKKEKEIGDSYKLLNMPSSTREEVVTKTKMAMKMAGYELKGDTSQVFSGGGSREEVKTDETYSETEKGKGSAKFLAPHLFKDKKE